MPLARQQRIPYLIAAVFLLIMTSMIGFALSVVYSLKNWQSSIPRAYARPLAIYQEISDAHSSLARLNSRVTESILAHSATTHGKLQSVSEELDAKLRKNFSAIRNEVNSTPLEIAEIDRLLDTWQTQRKKISTLLAQGHRNGALQLANGDTALTYERLEKSLDTAQLSAHVRAEALTSAAQKKSARLTHLAWWLLAGLAVSNILAGVLVVRRISKILERDEKMSKMLHENEERLKLALSGADEGTWDLDVPSGKINFDSQWGGILGYEAEKERPHSFREWAALIYADDKERVLGAMSDHVAGWSAEYRAEYRIRSRSGPLMWVVGHGRAVRRDREGKALRVVGVTRDITRRKEAEEKIWQLAHSDFLTGLPNRPLFYDRLQQSIAQAKRNNRKLALLFLDLDGFKQINDKFGHDTGDGLLQEVAKHLRQSIRGEDTVARTGGDEFIIILNEIVHADDAAIVAGKIIQSLSEPIAVGDNICAIGGSIGISVFPDDSDNMETLVSHADDAMYKAKEKGKNNFQFFAADR